MADDLIELALEGIDAGVENFESIRQKATKFKGKLPLRRSPSRSRPSQSDQYVGRQDGSSAGDRPDDRRRRYSRDDRDPRDTYKRNGRRTSSLDRDSYGQAQPDRRNEGDKNRFAPTAYNGRPPKKPQVYYSEDSDSSLEPSPRPSSNLHHVYTNPERRHEDYNYQSHAPYTPTQPPYPNPQYNNRPASNGRQEFYYPPPQEQAAYPFRPPNSGPQSFQQPSLNPQSAYLSPPSQSYRPQSAGLPAEYSHRNRRHSYTPSPPESPPPSSPQRRPSRSRSPLPARSRAQEIAAASLATVATIHAAASLYNSAQDGKERHRRFKEGKISAEKMRMEKAKTTVQDVAAVGIAALSIKGVYGQWKKARAIHRQHHEERIEARLAALEAEEEQHGGYRSDGGSRSDGGYRPEGRGRGRGWETDEEADWDSEEDRRSRRRSRRREPKTARPWESPRDEKDRPLRTA